MPHGNMRNQNLKISAILDELKNGYLVRKSTSLDKLWMDYLDVDLCRQDE